MQRKDPNDDSFENKDGKSSLKNKPFTEQELANQGYYAPSKLRELKRSGSIRFSFSKKSASDFTTDQPKSEMSPPTLKP